MEAGSAPTVVVVGHQNVDTISEKNKKSGVNIIRWEELMETESSGILDSVRAPSEFSLSRTAPESSSIVSLAPDDVFSVTFSGADNSGVRFCSQAGEVILNDCNSNLRVYS